MKKYLLGIDNGGTVCKAALFDLGGRQVLKKGITVPLSVNENGMVERDPNVIIEKNYELIREIQAGCDGEIAAIGLSGHGKGLYLLDKKGLPLGGGIGSTDTRALEYELMWEKDGTAAAARKKTFQRVLACQPVSLLRWMKDNDRETYEKIGSVLSVNDLVGYALTGNVFAERTEISGTNLLNLQTVSYDGELLSLFGVEETADALPPVISSFDVRGYVTGGAAEKTGLKEGTPVCGGMFDIDACALAAGTVNAGDMCMIAGTWSINEYISRAPVEKISMNSLYCIPGMYLAEESSAASAGNLEWMRDILREHSYRELDEMVGSVRPEKANVYFLPFLYASNLTPYARASLVGLESGHTEADVVRAVYEGVVFSGYTHLERLLDNCEKKPDFIRLAGGVVNSPVWVQMFADTAGIPVRVSEVSELGCLGAAMAAGVASGVYGSAAEAARICAGEGRLVCPVKGNTDIYREKYGVYRDIERALSPLWRRIRGI